MGIASVNGASEERCASDERLVVVLVVNAPASPCEPQLEQSSGIDSEQAAQRKRRQPCGCARATGGGPLGGTTASPSGVGSIAGQNSGGVRHRLAAATGCECDDDPQLVNPLASLGVGLRP